MHLDIYGSVKRNHFTQPHFAEELARLLVYETRAVKTRWSCRGSVQDAVVFRWLIRHVISPREWKRTGLPWKYYFNLMSRFFFLVRWTLDPSHVTQLTAARVRRRLAAWRRGRSVARRKSNPRAAGSSTDCSDWKRNWKNNNPKRDSYKKKKAGKKSTTACSAASRTSAAK